MSDDAKKTILARRAKFIAAAVATVGIACSKTQSSPEPCLSVTAERDAGAVPMPCLSPMPADRIDASRTDVDAGPDADSQAGAPTSATDAVKRPSRPPAVGPTATPVPCLSIKITPKNEPRQQ